MRPPLPGKIASVSEPASEASAVGATAANLLEGLRRLREDCHRLAEYNSTLNKALSKKQQHQSIQAARHRRHEVTARLQERLSRLLGDWCSRVLGLVLRSWRLRAHRNQRLLHGLAQTELQGLALRKWLGHWCLIVLSATGCAMLERQDRDAEATIAGIHLDALQAERLVHLSDRQRSHQRLQSLEMFRRRRSLHSYFSAFVQWVWETRHQELRHSVLERGIALLSKLGVRRLLQDCLASWYALALRNPKGAAAMWEHSALESRIQGYVAVQQMGDAEKTRRLIFDAWHFSALAHCRDREASELSEMQDKACWEEQQVSFACRNQTVARLAFCRIAHCESLLSFACLHAWKRLASFERSEAEHTLLQVRSALEVELTRRRRHAEGLWGHAVEATRNELLLRAYFLRWSFAYVHPVLAQTQAVVQESQITRVELQASQRGQQGLRKEIAATELAACLSKQTRPQQRLAMNVWRLPERTVEAEALRAAAVDMRAAHAASAELASERLVLNDALGASHQGILRLRDVAKETVLASTTHPRLLRTALAAWRISTLASASEGECAWHEQRRRSKVLSKNAVRTCSIVLAGQPQPAGCRVPYFLHNYMHGRCRANNGTLW
eukprot:TRINITY_DN11075_c0_g1_i5.p1 TRINITY_DN11075_c0_g1~~TRINITY_DN11075_c0_g1_i5.p1  ORF type:complete len:614 (+),score=106.56 TRINITY_DN11075_c0_g1_i5:43-1884(+)